MKKWFQKIGLGLFGFIILALDLQSIVLFIARDNPRGAESFGCLLMSKVDVLAQFPQLGRIVPEENNDTVRENIFRSYRIIYKVLAAEQMIGIARVWHGARGEPEIPGQLIF
jgi:toxin ParE1/3/4